MKQYCLLLWLLFSVAAVCGGGLRGPGAVIGGWKPMKDLSDPQLTEVANYAVSEFNSRSKTNLKLEKVEKGETQVVSGTNYRLVLAVKGGPTEKYEAIVWEKPWEKFKKLTSFKPVTA